MLVHLPLNLKLDSATINLLCSREHVNLRSILIVFCMISRRLVWSSLNKSLSLRIPLILISFYWQEKPLWLRSCSRSIHMVSTKDVNVVQNTESVTTVIQLLLVGLLSIVFLCYTVCYNGFTVRLPPFWDPVILLLMYRSVAHPCVGNLLLVFRGPFRGYCYGVYLCDYSGPLIWWGVWYLLAIVSPFLYYCIILLWCLTDFISLINVDVDVDHFFAQPLVNLDPLSDYVIVIYNFVLPIYVYVLVFLPL